MEKSSSGLYQEEKLDCLFLGFKISANFTQKHDANAGNPIIEDSFPEFVTVEFE